MPRLLMALCMIGSISGCTTPIRSSCAPGSGTPVAVFTLFFGKSIPGRGQLTDKEWLTFLDTIITVNLPNGYTAFDANGGWMNPVSHNTVKENTKVLLVALPDVPESLAPINRIRTAYQVEFHQQIVGMTIEYGCGSF